TGAGSLNRGGEVVAGAVLSGRAVILECGQGRRWVRPPIELADLASFSGHKLGSGPGGLLFVRSQARLAPLMYGGPQEWGRRAGHEDVASAAAVAAALGLCARGRDSPGIAARPASRNLAGPQSR